MNILNKAARSAILTIVTVVCIIGAITNGCSSSGSNPTNSSQTNNGQGFYITATVNGRAWKADSVFGQMFGTFVHVDSNQMQYQAWNSTDSLSYLFFSGQFYSSQDSTGSLEIVYGAPRQPEVVNGWDDCHGYATYEIDSTTPHVYDTIATGTFSGTFEIGSPLSTQIPCVITNGKFRVKL